MWIIIFGSVFAVLPTAFPQEKIQLPAYWGDNMIFQQGVPIPISGEAEPKEELTVSFGGQSQVTKADAEGRWSVILDAMAASAKPETLLVVGSCPKCGAELNNIVVGDVWICLGMSADQSASSLETEAVSSIRLLNIVSSSVPNGSWRSAKIENSPKLSSVSLAFAAALQDSQRVPVGLIQSDAPMVSGGKAKSSLPDPFFPVKGVLWSVDLPAYADQFRSIDSIRTMARALGWGPDQFLLLFQKAPENKMLSQGWSIKDAAADPNIRLAFIQSQSDATLVGRQLASIAEQMNVK